MPAIRFRRSCRHGFPFSLLIIGPFSLRNDCIFQEFSYIENWTPAFETQIYEIPLKGVFAFRAEVRFFCSFRRGGRKVRSSMGYIFDFKDATLYEDWCRDPANGFAADLQCRLMLDMLAPNKGESILDIGCGSGVALSHFVERGLLASGIDPSPYMLDLAGKRLGNRVHLHRGFAEELPFEDNEFNHAAFMITLEFVDDPKKALEEACRVAKDRLFIGVLNRFALKGIERRVKGVFTETIYNQARFFSVWELKGIVRELLGDVPISWRTVCQLSTRPGKLVSRIERLGVVQRCPFGAVLGMAVDLVPRLRTRPLTLKLTAKGAPKPVTGGILGLGARIKQRPNGLASKSESGSPHL